MNSLWDEQFCIPTVNGIRFCLWNISPTFMKNLGIKDFPGIWTHSPITFFPFSHHDTIITIIYDILKYYYCSWFISETYSFINKYNKCIRCCIRMSWEHFEKFKERNILKGWRVERRRAVDYLRSFVLVKGCGVGRFHVLRFKMFDVWDFLNKILKNKPY